ncbi:hypothetical protein BG006_003068 [Podila minutissima]|uniref:Uncharacterized protein n=1 Tax=Podila minutissima TaxID=64525 RepID=A0A9P5SC76_9FUNG|nr:hypothetical protein BG006_003068 [Podila minutissima]
MTQQDLANYLCDFEGFEGVELCQLGSFLKTLEEENLLGNLYQMTTLDGHVKRVCLDYYRVSYQETQTQKLRYVVKLTLGEFDEQLGRIEISLKSSFATAEVYNAFREAKGVLELIIDLSWECTRRIGRLVEALKTNSTLTTWDLNSNFIKDDRAQALAEPLRTNSTLISLNLKNNSIRLIGGQALAEARKTNTTLTTLGLMGNFIGDKIAQTLFVALKTTRRDIVP